jgi:hypothetical protein
VAERQEFDTDCPENSNQLCSFVGPQFWAGGSFVSTVDTNEQVVRAFIENPETATPGLGNLFDR